MQAVQKDLMDMLVRELKEDGFCNPLASGNLAETQ
jgi:hypothetical protein